VYIRKENERKERIEAFVETVRATGPISLDFRENLQKGYKALSAPVVNMVEELIMEADMGK
jgi:hypothetical protein